MTFELTINGHEWEKKHFDNVAAFCVLCLEQITNPTKGFCCSTCSLSVHKKCKESTTLSNLCVVDSEHGWTLDPSTTPALCMHCKKDLIGKGGKANGYMCPRCGKKAHPHCRNVSSKCEAVLVKPASSPNPGLPIPTTTEGPNSFSDRPLTPPSIKTRPRRNSHRNPLRTSLNMIKTVKQAFRNGVATNDSSSPPSPLLTPTNTPFSTPQPTPQRHSIAISTPYSKLSRIQSYGDIPATAYEIFSELDSLKVSQNSQKRKMFKLTLESLLLRLELLMEQSALSMPQLLHLQTLERGHVFTSSKMQHYESLFDHFISMFNKIAPEEKQERQVLIQAIKYRNFFHSHTFDAGNVLIGSTASEEIIAKVRAVTAPNVINNQPPSGVPSAKKGLVDSSLGSNSPISRHQLMDRILAWGRLDDRDVLAKAVKRFAALLENERLAQGDIVLVELPRNSLGLDLPGESIVFARYDSEGDKYGRTLNVLVEPTETHAIKVPYEKIFPLKKLGPEYLDMVESLRSMQKLVHNPTDVFMKYMNKVIKSITHKFLESNGVDVPFILRCIRKNVTVKEMAFVAETRQKLEDLNTIDLLAKVEGTCVQQIADFTKFLERQQEADLKFEFPTVVEDILQKEGSPVKIQHVDKYYYTAFKPFIPTIKTTISETQQFPFLVIASNRVRWYVGECEGTADKLKVERRDILNGKKKRELTDWWLQLIRTRVDDYLLSKDFDFEAVSSNYLDQPPRSFTAVRKNHRILLSILNPDTPKAKEETDQLILPIRAEVYEKIDMFLANAEATLQEQIQDQLQLPKGEGTEIYAQIRANIKKLDPTLGTWVKNTIDDIEYIKEMKRLDFEFYGNDPHRLLQKDANSAGGLCQTVPVIGLIMGRFNRFENEQRTVLDVWGSKMPKEEEEDMYARVPADLKALSLDLPRIGSGSTLVGVDSGNSADFAVNKMRARSLGEDLYDGSDDTYSEGSRASADFMFEDTEAAEGPHPSLIKYLKEDSNEFVFEFSD